MALMQRGFGLMVRVEEKVEFPVTGRVRTKTPAASWSKHKEPRRNDVRVRGGEEEGGGG